MIYETIKMILNTFSWAERNDFILLGHYFRFNIRLIDRGVARAIYAVGGDVIIDESLSLDELLAFYENLTGHLMALTPLSGKWGCCSYRLALYKKDKSILEFECYNKTNQVFLTTSKIIKCLRDFSKVVQISC